MDFDECLRNATERDRCLDQKCATACEGAIAHIQGTSTPLVVWSASFKFRKPSDFSVPTLYEDESERSAEQLRMIAERRVPIGHFKDIQPGIDGLLGSAMSLGQRPLLEKAAVQATDDLVVYMFGSKNRETVESAHAKLETLTADLRGWLMGHQPEVQKDGDLLVVYINVGPPVDGDTLMSTLHGRENQTLGYYEPLDNSVMVCETSTPTALGTPRHEVAHAILHEDFLGIPSWLDEGVAALYERTMPGNGPVPRPLDNWRLGLLLEDDLRTIAANRPSTRQLLDPSCQSWSADYYPIAAAASRYWVWYLLDRGQLPVVYRALRDGEPYSLVFDKVARSIAAEHNLALAADADPYEFLDRELDAFIAARAKRSRRELEPLSRSGWGELEIDSLRQAKPSCVATATLDVGFGDDAPLGLEPEQHVVESPPPPIKPEPPPALESSCACDARSDVGTGLGWLGLLVFARCLRRRGG